MQQLGYAIYLNFDALRLPFFGFSAGRQQLLCMNEYCCPMPLHSTVFGSPIIHEKLLGRWAHHEDLENTQLVHIVCSLSPVHTHAVCMWALRGLLLSNGTNWRYQASQQCRKVVQLKPDYRPAATALACWSTSTNNSMLTNRPVIPK